MRLEQAARLRRAQISGIQAGGPGSGCRGPNCGRPCLTPGCPEHDLSVVNKPKAERNPKGWLANVTPLRHAEVDIYVDGDQSIIEKRMNGLTARQVTAVYLKDVKDLEKVNVTFETNDNGSVTVSINGFTGGTEFSMQRYFRGTYAIVDHDNFKIDEYAQGSGLGKTIFRNSLDLYDHTGEDRIGLSANVDVGGYAWARYGFVPTKGSWTAWKEEHGELNLEEIEPAMASREIGRLLKSPDPRSMWKIADMTMPNGEGSEISVGKKMLMRTNWDGDLDLNNVEQYSRARIYTRVNQEKKQAA